VDISAVCGQSFEPLPNSITVQGYRQSYANAVGIMSERVQDELVVFSAMINRKLYTLYHLALLLVTLSDLLGSILCFLDYVVIKLLCINPYGLCGIECLFQVILVIQKGEGEIGSA